MASRSIVLPQEMIGFLRDLKNNNNREWFQANKGAYEDYVKAPMAALVEAVNADLVGHSPEHVTDPKKAIYRIYRDTRFSNDKTPYKIHVGANFPRRGLDKHGGAGYYFHVGADDVVIACGSYMPAKDELLAIRTHIAGHYEELAKIVRKKRVRDLMGELKGESLTRPPKGFPKDHPAIDRIKAKQWYFYQTLDPKAATQQDFLKQITSRFRLMREFVEFLNAPLLTRLKADPDPARFFAAGP